MWLSWNGQKFKFLCKLIGCEAQEGAEWTMNQHGHLLEGFMQKQ